MNATQAARSPVRSANNRKVLGVCGGIAEYLGIDPLVVRIAIAVLAVFGGLGVVLYLLGAALLPDPGDTTDLLSGRRLGWLLLAGFAGLIVLPGYLFGFGGDAFPVNLALLVAVGALVVYLARRPVAGQPQAAMAPAAPPGEAETALAPEPGDADTAVAGYGAMPYPPSPPEPRYAPAPKLPRKRSYLGGIALGTSLIWFGLAWSLNAVGITSMSVVTIFGVSLAILGAGILVGAWIGRARWLVLFALPLSLVVWGLTVVPDSVRLDQAPQWLTDGTGDESVPGGAESFDLGIGRATLDVAAWSEAQAGRVDVSVGVGELVVYVPDTWDVEVLGEVGLGSISENGIRLADGPDLSERLLIESPNPDAPRLVVDARVDLGGIRVITTSTQIVPSLDQGSVEPTTSDEGALQ